MLLAQVTPFYDYLAKTVDENIRLKHHVKKFTFRESGIRVNSELSSTMLRNKTQMQ